MRDNGVFLQWRAPGSTAHHARTAVTLTLAICALAGCTGAPGRGAAAHDGPLVTRPEATQSLTPATGLAPTTNPASTPADASTSTSATAAARPGKATTSSPSAASWSHHLKARPPRTPAAIVADAPAGKPVELVTVEDRAGRPVISTIVAADRTAAEAEVRHRQADPAVLDVSLAQPVHVLDSPRRPLALASPSNDPFRAKQWALTTLEAEDTWLAQPGRGVVVAVIDTGVQADHPDLAGVVVPGRDLVAGSGSGRIDPHGHGTHVAGVVAALGGNGVGVAGLGQGLRVMPIRALDKDGVGSDATVAAGIVWAADNGAKVINLSIGSPDYSPAEAAATFYATARGALVVAASGNQRGQGNATSYPGAFPGVLAVAASDNTGRTATFSNSGPYVDVTAPGVNIISTYPPAGYAYMDGTSMSAPYVAAAAALVRAAAPTLTPAQVTAVLQQTAKDVETAGKDTLSGAGLIQPLAAITAARRLAASAALTASPTTSPLPSPAATSSANPTISPSTSPSTSPSVSPSIAPLPAPTRTVASLSLVSATTRVGYRRAGSVTFQLRQGSGADARALSGTAVSVCVTGVGRRTASCSNVTSDSAGKVVVRPVLSNSSTVQARFAGSTGMAPASSSPVTVTVLPALRLVAGTRSATFTMTPTVAGQRIQVQRLNGSTWSTISTKVLPATGRIVLTGLTSGRTYRVSAPASVLTGAAVSSSAVAR